MSNKSEASRTLRVFPQVLGERREKFRMKSEVHCYRIPVKLFPLSILSLKWRSSTLFDQVYCRFHHGQKVWQLNILEIKKRNGSDKRWKRCVLLWIYWRRPWVISLFLQYYWKASILVSVCRCQWDQSHSGTGPCHYPRKYTINTCLCIDSIFTWIVTRPCVVTWTFLLSSNLVEITDFFSRLPKKFSGMYLQHRMEMQSKKIL
jgi:hypothetical protein